jgi:hypothetical protein
MYQDEGELVYQTFNYLYFQLHMYMFVHVADCYEGSTVEARDGLFQGTQSDQLYADY